MFNENDIRLIERLTRRNSRRRVLKRGLALLSAVVLLWTMNTLKLRVIAMEHRPTCGYDYEHVHTVECFDEAGNLICPLHEHTDACYQEAPVPEEVEVDLGAFEDDELVEIGEAPMPLAADETLADGEAGTAQEAPAFDMEGRAQVTLGEVLALTALPVERADIQMVGLVDDAGLGDDPIAIALVDEEITITALRAFETVEIAIVTADDILTVNLLNGAPEAAEAPAEDAEEDAEKDADADAGEPAEDAESDVEENTEENNGEAVGELGEQDLEAVAGESAEGDAGENDIEENTEEAADADAGDFTEENAGDGESVEAEEEQTEVENDTADETEEDAAEADENAEDGESAEAQEEQTEVENNGTEEEQAEEEAAEASEEDKAEEEAAEASEEEKAEEEAAEASEEDNAEEEAAEASEEEKTEEEDKAEEEAAEDSEEDNAEETEEVEAEEAEAEEAEAENAEAEEAETEEAEAEKESETTPEALLAALYPAQTFEAFADNVRVNVTAEVGAFPAGTEMRVTPVWDTEKLDGIADTVAEEFVEVKKVLAVDIAFFNADGEEIEPLLPISVVMTVEEIAENQDAVVVHMDDDGNTEVVEQAEAVQADDAQLALNVELPAAENAEALTEQALAEAAAETEAEGDLEADEAETEADGTEAEGDLEADEAETEADETEVESDETVPAEDAAPAEEASVEYGSEAEAPAPEAAGQALEVFEEAIPTESVVFEADAFSVYAVVVTETIETRYIAADGASFAITVGYGPEAEIPAGAELAVREITDEDMEYERYLNESAEAIAANGVTDPVASARFFDIEIVSEGQKVEPAAPVEVNIRYDDALELAEDAGLSVVHFADAGTEVIEDIELSEDGTQITYCQASFSVTGTLITYGGSIHEGTDYFVLLKQTETDDQNVTSDHYYLILKDGELEEVTLGDNNKFYVSNPMMWKFRQDNGSYYLSHEAYARTIGDWSKQANSWYYNYIDPNSPDGVSLPTTMSPVECADQVANTIQLSTDGENAEKKRESAIVDVRSNGKIRSAVQQDGTYYYIGISGQGENARLVGRVTEAQAADVRFATVDQILPSGNNSWEEWASLARNNQVRHIDIGIDATAELHIPLGPGKYYNANHEVVLTVPDGEVRMLRVVQKVPVEIPDIKNATIETYKKNPNGTKQMVDNMYHITGYSGNAPVPNAPAQVRIEGIFQVADFQLPDWVNPYDPGETYRQQRLNNQIYYTLSTKKEVVFDLKLDDDPNPYDNVDQRTQLYNARGQALTSSSIVELSASFSYWDYNNTCPALHEGFNAGNDYWESRWYGENDYRLGWFYDNHGNRSFTGIIPQASNGGSGLDFLLSGSTEGYAVIVTKMIVDESGNLIATQQQTQNTVDILRKAVDANNPRQETDKVGDRKYVNGDRDLNYGSASGPYGVEGYYTNLGAKDITVGTNGYGTVYDYTIDPGMIGIREHDDFDKEIVDAQGRVWEYKETYFKTEYASRNGGDSGLYHKTVKYTCDDAGNFPALVSVPEVLGSYKGDSNDDRSKDSLAFYIYNVYQPKPTEVEVEKKWKQGDADYTNIPADAEVDVFLKRFKLAYKDGYNHIVDNVIKAKIDIFQSNYGHNTRYSNTEDFEAGQTVTVSYKRKYNEPGGYSINGGPKTAFTVYADANKPADCDSDGFISESFTAEIPEDGVLNIALDDSWGEIKSVRVVSLGNSINLSKAVRRRAVNQQATNTNVVAPPAPFDKPDMEYVVDDAFDEVLVELRVGNQWKNKATDLAAYDENGNAYLYFINRVEERNVPEGTKIEIDLARDGSTLTSVGDTTLTVTNQMPTSVNLQKTDENGEALEGAKFSLSMKVNGEWSIVEGYGEIDLSDTSRKTLSGLFGGRYKLVETEAPDGHIILRKEIYFTIKDGVVSLTDENGASADSETYDGMIALAADTISVKNPAGARLPSTGGAGTGAYTLAGGALALLALALLLAKRREA